MSASKVDDTIPTPPPLNPDAVIIHVVALTWVTGLVTGVGYLVVDSFINWSWPTLPPWVLETWFGVGLGVAFLSHMINTWLDLRWRNREGTRLYRLGMAKRALLDTEKKRVEQEHLERRRAEQELDQHEQ